MFLSKMFYFSPLVCLVKVIYMLCFKLNHETGHFKMVATNLLAELRMFL